jgi:O-antigen ligase
MGDSGFQTLLILTGFCGFLGSISLIMTRPFLGIVFLMVIHFWLGSIEAVIYPRILSIILVASIMIPIFAVKQRMMNENFNFDLTTKKLLGLSIIIFLWENVVNHIVYLQGFNVFIATIARVLLPIILSTLIYIAIQNKEQFHRYNIILILLISVSALIGILQFLGISWAWKMRVIQGGYTLSSISEPAGLALYSLHFAYQLSYVFPFALSLTMKDKFLQKSNVIFIAALILFFVALILTTVRSAILGMLIGSMFTLVKLKKFKKGLMATVALGIIAVSMFLFMDISSVLEIITTYDDKSAVGRIPLFLTGLYIAKDNLLFGVGYDRFHDYTDHYYGNIYNMQGAAGVSYHPPHNQFINILVYFGIPGFLLLSAFYLVIVKKLSFMQNFTDPYFSCISAGLLGSYISYIINSSFHNLGPFLSDPYAWFFIGATFVLFKFNE